MGSLAWAVTECRPVHCSSNIAASYPVFLLLCYVRMPPTVLALLSWLALVKAQGRECSNFAEPDYRLSNSISRELTSARDDADCEEQCLLSTRFTCKTFAFKYGSRGFENCELSDRDFRDIQPRTDLDPDRDWDVFERTRYTRECRDKSNARGNGDSIIIERLSCYTKYRSDTAFRSQVVVETITARDEEECARECDYYRGKGQYQCNAFSFRRNVRSYSDNCLLSDSYGGNIDVDLEFALDYSVYEFSGETRNCRSEARNNEANEVGMAGEYTVNGQRCLRGGCRLNPDVNYWYCEIEEDRGWDYCCRPQWRPCDSERARRGDRRSGWDSSGRPRYAYLHEDKPPQHVHSHSKAVPFNSNAIPFMSINEYEDKHPSQAHTDNRVDDVAVFNSNNIRFISLNGHRIDRRSEDSVDKDEIEDNFLSDTKANAADARMNSKLLPFLSPLMSSNDTRQTVF